jgi:hypothetical protein
VGLASLVAGALAHRQRGVATEARVVVGARAAPERAAPRAVLHARVRAGGAQADVCIAAAALAQRVAPRASGMRMECRAESWRSKYARRAR